MEKTNALVILFRLFLFRIAQYCSTTILVRVKNPLRSSSQVLLKVSVQPFKRQRGNPKLSKKISNRNSIDQMTWSTFFKAVHSNILVLGRGTFVLICKVSLSVLKVDHQMLSCLTTYFMHCSDASRKEVVEVESRTSIYYLLHKRKYSTLVFILY